MHVQIVIETKIMGGKHTSRKDSMMNLEETSTRNPQCQGRETRRKKYENKNYYWNKKGSQ